MTFLVSRRSHCSPNHVRSSVHLAVCSLVTQFLKNLSLLFSETFQLVRACKCEKNVPSAFLIIFTVIWLDVCNSLFKGWKSLKNLKVGGFETDFKQVPAIVRQKTCSYSVHIFCWFAVGKKMTQKPKFGSKNIFP